MSAAPRGSFEERGAHAGERHYYYTNAQGTVLAKIDAQGNIIARYDYKPYGGPMPNALNLSLAHQKTPKNRLKMPASSAMMSHQ